MKPTLTSEQSTALTRAIADLGKSEVIRNHADLTTKWIAHLSALNDIDLLTLSAALVNGWEVEKSPVDTLRENYAVRRAAPAEDSRARCYCAGVLEALRATGQTIEGINA